MLAELSLFQQTMNNTQCFSCRFIDRIQPDSEAKAEWYSRVGLNLQAARTAESLRNADLLTKIQGAVGANSSMGIKMAQMIDRLKRQQNR